MQIVIPMSGFGERFRNAGYQMPKPLIHIDGKPIIEYVVEMFPGETDFFFICNNDHLATPEYNLENTLREICPTGRIIGIAPHKLGPIYAVNQVIDLLDQNKPVLVNYCDFTCYWKWADFKKFVQESECIGAIPAYKNFHPHTLGDTNYAYLLEKKGIVSDIQEKKPYTDNRMDEFASSGSYYFRSVSVMAEAFEEVLSQNLHVGGEYYVSLAYKPLLEIGHLVLVYPLQHFMQWGTPEDVFEYQMWSKAFKKLLDPTISYSEGKGSIVIPMAGMGQRFANEGYDLTKPMIPVSGQPMVIQATNDLPYSESQVFILRSNMIGCKEISKKINEFYPDAVIKTIDNATEGQAITASIGLEALDNLGQLQTPITIAACDNGVLYNEEKYKQLVEDKDVEVIVWGIRGYANAKRSPEMFGWIDLDSEGFIERVSVKTPLSSPLTDPIVLGTFTFKDGQHFMDAIESLISRNGRINGEYYIDSLINDAIDLGLRCKLLEVESYLCWGTPNDLKTFEYWQSCFHKWSSHPYRLEKDNRVSAEARLELDKKYRRFNEIAYA